MEAETKSIISEELAALKDWLDVNGWPSLAHATEEVPMTGAELAASVNWSDLGQVFQTLYCRCGMVYRSHHKLVRKNDSFVGVAEKPCPDCGEHTNIRRASSDPESYSIGR